MMKMIFAVALFSVLSLNRTGYADLKPALDDLVGADSIVLSEGAFERQDEGREKTCGSVSYDTSGGSLVINDRVKVQVANPGLLRNLMSEVQDQAVQLCLYGVWIAPNRIFSAVDYD